MTIASERTNAVLAAERLLLDILHRKIKRVPEEIRVRARIIIKHFPTTFDLSQSHKALPETWGDPKKDRGVI